MFPIILYTYAKYSRDFPLANGTQILHFYRVFSLIELLLRPGPGVRPLRLPARALVRQTQRRPPLLCRRPGREDGGQPQGHGGHAARGVRQGRRGAV